jgi:SAM-dependent methyltransferase
MAYADARFWDGYYRGLRQTGREMDWEGLWTRPFLAPLREAGARTVLELGCGTGNDAARLAREGYQVTATDLSAEAIGVARDRFGHAVRFLIADTGLPLPFRDASVDAVMSNVALHMFPDGVTHSVFAEIRRLVRPGGLFLFHVNATEDRPLRARWRPVARELEPDFVLEECGQTMHFFSERYLRELLQEWDEPRLDPVEIAHPETGEKFKHVWRGIAHR